MNIRTLVKRLVPSCLLQAYRKQYHRYLTTHPKYAINIFLKSNTGVEMDFKHPRDINQKINWLKLYGNTCRWPMLADKWAVRQFVSDQGLGDILVDNYGHWDDASQINFDKLRYPCVIKTNHGCGMNLFLHNKPSENELPHIISKLNDWVHTPFSDMYIEPHYSKIKPCLLAEELLEEKNPISSSIIDYKVFAFDGTPVCVLTCCNRTQDNVELSLYDLDWNLHPECSLFNKHYIKGKLFGKLDRPKNLERMIKAASILSKGEPQARIDFYEVNGKLYFSEITMTSQGGYMSYFTHDFLLKLGDYCHLPTDSGTRTL